MKNNFISKLQTIFGISKNEAVITIIILFGLLLGSIIKLTKDNSSEENKQNKELFKLLDSLAESDEMNDSNKFNLNNESSSFTRNSMYQSKKLATEPVDINNADKSMLVQIPGVGEQTADRIIEYRKTNKIRNFDDMTKIKGIGKKKAEKMVGYIKFE